MRVVDTIRRQGEKFTLVEEDGYDFVLYLVDEFSDEPTEVGRFDDEPSLIRLHGAIESYQN